jgi:hypothetical protein
MTTTAIWPLLHDGDALNNVCLTSVGYMYVDGTI